MEAMEELMAHVRARPVELKRLREEGTKIVGYIPSYVPEELICASGAIPVGLICGGDHEPVAASEAYIIRFIDTFCRAQIGYRALGEKLLYQLPDLLVVPITDRNITAIADSWQLWTDVDIFKLGVPKYTKEKHALDYYLEGLGLLKQRLEQLTGIEITDEKLKAEIDLSNRIRSLLEEISYTRRSECPPISGSDFVKLNHATYYADRHTLVRLLQSIAEELKKQEASRPEGPRIMLTGSTMAEGDYKVVDLLEKGGAAVVIEEFCEGVRHYWQKVDVGDNLMEALVDRYLARRTPGAFFRNCIKERADFLLDLIREFNIDGVLWYSLMYRDSYDRHGIFFSQILPKEAGVAYYKLSSDYDVAETGPMRTRIETFIEMAKAGKGG